MLCRVGVLPEERSPWQVLSDGAIPGGWWDGWVGSGERTSLAPAGARLTGVGITEAECSPCCPSRYLIPCNHMMLSQRWAVKERDCYSVSAAKLLALTPVCCSSGITLTLGNQERDYILWSKWTHDSAGKGPWLVNGRMPGAIPPRGVFLFGQTGYNVLGPISFMNPWVVFFCVWSYSHFVINVH